MRKTDFEKKKNEKIAALATIFEYGYSTKTLLRQKCSERNLAELISDGLIESVRKEILLSENTKRVTITVYRLQKSGLNLLRAENPDKFKSNYCGYSYDENLLVHDLYLQSYLAREQLELVAATSSIDKLVAHRRHTKNVQWLTWRYDAIAKDDDSIYAIEVERHKKTPSNTAFFLSKLRDFLAGYKTGGKVHKVIIVATTPEMAAHYRKIITEPFDHCYYRVGEKKPYHSPIRVKIQNPERIKIVLFTAAELRKIALPPEQRKPTDSAFGTLTPTKKPLRSREIANLTPEEIRDKAEIRAVERLEADLAAKIRAKYHDELIARNRALRAAVYQNNELLAEISQLKEQLKETEIKLADYISRYDEAIDDLLALGSSVNYDSAALDKRFSATKRNSDLQK